MALGVHTHTLWQHESDFKKPGARWLASGAPGLKTVRILDC